MKSVVNRLEKELRSKVSPTEARPGKGSGIYLREEQRRLDHKRQKEASERQQEGGGMASRRGVQEAERTDQKPGPLLRHRRHAWLQEELWGNGCATRSGSLSSGWPEYAPGCIVSVMERRQDARAIHACGGNRGMSRAGGPAGVLPRMESRIMVQREGRGSPPHLCSVQMTGSGLPVRRESGWYTALRPFLRSPLRKS